MIKIISLLISAFVFVVSAADLNTVTYSPVTRGNSVKDFGGTVYFATDGGIVILKNDMSASVYDVDDGLYKPVVQKVEKDFRGHIWAGHPDCSFSILDISSGASQYVNDIEQSGTYSLNAVRSSSKYVYIAASGLLSRYRYNNDFRKYEISDTNLMTGAVKDVIVHLNNIYISTESGVRFIAEDSQNINYLGNWDAVSGFGGVSVNSFISDGDRLIALSDTGLFLIDGDTAEKQSVFEGKKLFSGTVADGMIYVLTEQPGASVILSSGNDFTGQVQIYYGADDSVPQNFSFAVLDGKAFLGRTSGLYIYDGSSDESMLSFGLPFEKGIIKMTMSRDGERLLYMTPMRFSYFNIADNAFSEDVYDFAYQGKNILESSSGDVYTGSWSTGVNRFEWDGNKYTKKQNYSLSSFLAPPDTYSVHPGIAEDNSGNIWITSFQHYEPEPDPVLFRISPSGEIKSYSYESFPSGAYEIFIDDNDWIWVGSSTQQFNKLNGLAVGKPDGDVLSINVLDINAGIVKITKDRDEVIWIGTNNGVKYIDLKSSPSNPLSLSTANVSHINTGTVGNFIYDVSVNSINEKWFATDKGVSVLSPDNREWRHYVPKYFSARSSVPGDIIRTNLIDDVITGIEFDEKNGTAILSSHNGLVFIEYANIFYSPEIEKGKIQTRPSPFLIDSSTTSLRLWLSESDRSKNINRAKIYDLKGSLVKDLDGSGGMSQSEYFDFKWDGKDNKGRLLSTGIYQIVLYNNSDRTQKINGKIAVVRK